MPVKGNLTNVFNYLYINFIDLLTFKKHLSVMKKFLFTLAALFMAVSAMADSGLYIPDFTLTQDDLGQEIDLSVAATFSARISGLDVEFTYPEGIECVYAEKGADADVTYKNSRGKNATANAALYGAAEPFDHFVFTLSDNGYWQDPNGENPTAWVTYGVVKWEAGEYEEMLLISIVADPSFTGGDIIVKTTVASGTDTRGGTVRENGEHAQSFTYVCHVTVEGAEPPAPEQTEAPVITWTVDEENQQVVVTATGNGTVILYNDDIEVARGEGEATYVVPFTEDPEGEEMGFSATAQEEGKEVSEYALATIFVPGKPVTPPEPEVTATPVVTVETTDEAVIITATGDGEVHLYVNDEEVENPYIIPRGEEDVNIFVYATAQEDGKEMATSEVEPIVVPAVEGGEEPPVDPHAEGVWIVSYDVNGEEVWQELNMDNGDYTGIVRFGYGIYGTFDYYGGGTRPNVEYIFVVNGVRYGAAADGTLTVLGDAMQNPLYENENHYVLEEGVGKVYQMGIAIDEFTGDMYVYAAVAGFTELDEMNADKAVAGVRYFNMAGQEMQEANGVTIVVTTYTDGTTSAVKVIK